jgi:hypothetical protein
MLLPGGTFYQISASTVFILAVYGITIFFFSVGWEAIRIIDESLLSEPAPPDTPEPGSQP